MENTTTLMNKDQDPNVNGYKAAGTSPPRKPKAVPHLDSRQIRELKCQAGLDPYHQRLKLHKAGGQYQACCPWHHDTNPSLSIFEGKEGDYRFKCFACSESDSDASGDVIAFVQRMEHVSFAEAVSRIAGECGYQIQPVPEGSPKKFDYDRQKGTARLDEVKDYLASRGISLDIAQEYGFGAADVPKIGLAVAMPYDESVVKFRAVNPASKGDKFRHLSGKPSADLLFGSDKLENFDPFLEDPNIYVVESEMDSLTLKSHGFRSVSVSSATTCIDSNGNLKFDKAVLDKLNETAERIYIATDMDSPGKRCADAFLRALPPYKTRRLQWLYGGKDSQDPKDIGELYQQNPTGFRERVEKLTAEVEERARRVVTVYSDLPKAFDLGKNIRPVNWLVKDIIPLNDKAILCGYWGNYKSYIALSLAKAVATGTKFLGLYDTQQRPVIYLDKENSRDEIGDRAKRLQIPEDAELRIWCEQNVPFPKINDSRLLAFAEELKPLFIVDTLTGFSEAEDENAAREMRRELEKYLELISRGGTVLALHHPAKNRTDTSDTNWFRGSGDIGAFFSMGFYVTCTDEKLGIIDFKTKKSRRGPKLHVQVQAWPYLDPTNPQYKGDFAVIENEGGEPEDPRLIKLQQLIADSPGINQQDLIAKSGLGPGEARGLLDKHEGELWRSAKVGKNRKYYVLSGPAKSLLFGEEGGA